MSTLLLRRPVGNSHRFRSLCEGFKTNGEKWVVERDGQWSYLVGRAGLPAEDAYAAVRFIVATMGRRPRPDTKPDTIADSEAYPKPIPKPEPVTIVNDPHTHTDHNTDHH